MRVAIGGISHETNTFSSIQTDLTSFRRRALLRGQALVEGSRGAANVLGGMVDTAMALGWELEPVLFASAVPSGRVQRGTFEALANELVSGISAAGRDRATPLDGVLLVLHGAMVSEALADAEGEVLRRVRSAVGPSVPIVAVFDLHANLTPAVAEHADIVLAYETYPHIDTYTRGSEAVTLLERLHRREFRPAHALVQVPLLTPLPAQWTEGPTAMRDLAQIAAQLRQASGVIAVVLAPGFPYSDVPDAGMSVLVTTDRDAEHAQRLARRLAVAAWERRALFRPEVTSIAEAIELAGKASETPVILADVADNPGAGGSGDGTAILEALLAARFAGAAVGVIADPETVRQARQLGAGNRGQFRLGGKVDHLHGATLEVEARVRAIGDLSFVNRGPMGTGGTTRAGRMAVLEVVRSGAAGDPPVEVIVTEQRVQVLDPELFRAAGIEPEQRRVLVVKSSVHFRAAFAPMAGTVLEVDGPGLSSPDLLALPYRNVRRPIWPLDRDAEFE
jgi:microcystin degradation protein MlrC